MKLTLKDKRIFALIIQKDKIKHIATLLDVIPENVHSTLKRLKDKGLIEKHKDYYRLTPKGRYHHKKL